MPRYLSSAAALFAALVLLWSSPGLADGLELPASLVGKAVVLTAGDPDYALADVGDAVKPVGDGGISAALVIRLDQDLAVYRLWNGPAKLDANGNTNRLGGWWSYDAPRGTVAAYRIAYEICPSWNDLTWVASCTLKKGAVVAIGPGQSVSAATCGDPGGAASYPANPADWQTFVNQPWKHPETLECPPVGADYPADPNDIAKALPAAGQ